ncbi:MAG: hypothetical protein IIA54_02620, partial [Chloroflexi bacterium]|nr:hypothetical protein [Chloroflexota bacterium]
MPEEMGGQELVAPGGGRIAAQECSGGFDGLFVKQTVRPARFAKHLQEGNVAGIEGKDLLESWKGLGAGDLEFHVEFGQGAGQLRIVQAVPNGLMVGSRREIIFAERAIGLGESERPWSRAGRNPDPMGKNAARFPIAPSRGGEFSGQCLDVAIIFGESVMGTKEEFGLGRWQILGFKMEIDQLPEEFNILGAQAIEREQDFRCALRVADGLRLFQCAETPFPQRQLRERPGGKNDEEKDGQKGCQSLLSTAEPGNSRAHRGQVLAGAPNWCEL